MRVFVAVALAVGGTTALGLLLTEALEPRSQAAEWAAFGEALRRDERVVSEVHGDPSALDGSAGALFVVPARARSEADVAAVLAFHGEGGRLLVLGDPPLASRLGVVLGPSPIEEPQRDTVEASIVGRDGTIVAALPAPHPVLDGREGSRVLASTANASFVDVDGDRSPTAGDAGGPFAVAVRVPDGRAVVVGEDSLSGAAFTSTLSNPAFFLALVDEVAPRGAPVVFDSTGAEGPAGLAGIALAAAERADGPVASLAIAAAGAAATAAAATSRPNPGRRDGGIDLPVLVRRRPR